MSLVAIRICGGNACEIYALEQNGKSELLEFLAGIPEKERIPLMRALDWTAEQGLLRNERRFKRLTDEISEFKTHGGIRVLCFMDGRRIVVLTNGFTKKKKYDSEIRRAENLRLAYLAAKQNECLTYREEPST
jgi:hypothetical protein